MSNWWYLECINHDPPLRTADAVAQHTRDLAPIRDLLARRASLSESDIPSTPRAWTSDNVDDHFARTTIDFLLQHPNCQLQLASETGAVELFPDQNTRTSGTARHN